MGDRGQPHQVDITRLVLRQQYAVLAAAVKLRILVSEFAAGDIDLAADDGLNACFAQGLVELQGTVHDPVVGERIGRVTQLRTRAAMSRGRAMLSRSEYSLWLCKWTKPSNNPSSTLQTASLADHLTGQTYYRLHPIFRPHPVVAPPVRIWDYNAGRRLSGPRAKVQVSRFKKVTALTRRCPRTATLVLIFQLLVLRPRPSTLGPASRPLLCLSDAGSPDRGRLRRPGRGDTLAAFHGDTPLAGERLRLGHPGRQPAGLFPAGSVDATGAQQHPHPAGAAARAGGGLPGRFHYFQHFQL